MSKHLPQNSRILTGIVLGISILIHLVLLWLFSPVLPDDEHQKLNRSDDKSISVIFDIPKSEPAIQQPEQPPSHYIQLPRPERQEIPDNARFLERYDRTVEKEQIAPPQKTTTPQSAVSDRRESEPKTDTRDAARRPEVTPKTPAPQDIAPVDAAHSEEVNLADDGMRTTNTPPDKQPPDSDGEQREASKIDTSKLFPTFDNTPHHPSTASNSPPAKLFRDIDEGETTLLNSRRTKYWSFYDRLRYQIAQHWSPQRVYMKHDPDGQIYGVRSRTTLLHITLNGDGSVRRIYIAEPSGLDFLDREAIRAVRTGAPFPNPPEGLKDNDGLIHLGFSFHLDLSRNARIGLRRMNR